MKKQQAGAELRLAHNQTAPSVDLVSTFSRDWGSGSITKVGSEVKAGVVFELPLQRRKALGKVAAQEAKIGQLDDELAFGRDRVVADVRDAAGELIASRERLILTRQEVEVSRQLEEAERVRFALGDSTLFIVNLRELATADSEIRETKAQADYFKALAEYRAAIAGF